MTESGAEVAHVELCDIDLAFGRRTVFERLSCRFPRGRISVIMGGSGMGKSTILRLIGGLQAPDRGRVVVRGQDVAGLGENAMSRVRQSLGMLFQKGALLDSMTIFENLALPLQEHTHMTAAEIEGQVHERLESVGLAEVDELLPGELSGGMLRRAAFARAIMMSPEILLCDEPFSGLDPPNVSRIEALLRHLNDDLGLTLIITSHHMATSLRLADQLLLLQGGGCVSGAPVELAGSHDSAVAEFIGEDGAEYLARLVQRGPEDGRA